MKRQFIRVKGGKWHERFSEPHSIIIWCLLLLVWHCGALFAYFAEGNSDPLFWVGAFWLFNWGAWTWENRDK